MLPPLGTSRPLRRGFFVRVGSDFRQKPTARLDVKRWGCHLPGKLHDASTKLSPAFGGAFSVVGPVCNPPCGSVLCDGFAVRDRQAPCIIQT